MLTYFDRKALPDLFPGFIIVITFHRCIIANIVRKYVTRSRSVMHFEKDTVAAPGVMSTLNLSRQSLLCFRRLNTGDRGGQITTVALPVIRSRSYLHAWQPVYQSRSIARWNLVAIEQFVSAINESYVNRLTYVWDWHEFAWAMVWKISLKKAKVQLV